MTGKKKQKTGKKKQKQQQTYTVKETNCWVCRRVIRWSPDLPENSVSHSLYSWEKYSPPQESAGCHSPGYPVMGCRERRVCYDCKRRIETETISPISPEVDRMMSRSRYRNCNLVRSHEAQREILLQVMGWWNEGRTKPLTLVYYEGGCRTTLELKEDSVPSVLKRLLTRSQLRLLPEPLRS